MGRPTNKTDLISAANTQFDRLWQIIDTLPEAALDTRFDFTDDPKKKEAHWQRDKNLRDVLIHLYEWHQLLLNWINSNTSGEPAPFLPAPYNWKTYGDMNIELWKKHQKTSLGDAKEMLLRSHDSVMRTVNTFSNRQLFEKNVFDWTGTTTLGSYCISALSSHYDWATKKLKAHVKNLETV
ncbi:ClbS/DfsB family four-helix bundle protein [Reinekea blandensis]|uniref:DinB-like domain-containing protein n=1 Tax=Reinekea blandensis MED297 TaxID=314283 RepID=A4BG75_9GAMM|nr:ClbS/DfsB family four-helix bundle protein [Reinekea blandensis]EAR08870.1 hypothetical protein MED297_04352 [Reinekea sp. MED297] [Reinekea blandensis MED297]